MKNEEAKQILSVYRPSGEDASHPVFQEALEQARQDPELAAWFKDERERDAELAEIFQSLPVPEGGKRSLLALAHMEPVEKKQGFWLWSGALAACLALALGLTFLVMPSLRPAPKLVLHEGRELGTAELVELAHAALPLDFRAQSVPELRAWLAGRGAPVPGSLPGRMAILSAVGCRVFSDDFGNTLTLLCLDKDGELVHLFVAEGKAREALTMEEKTWIAQNGWNAYRWSDGDKSYVMLSRAQRADLEGLVVAEIPTLYKYTAGFASDERNMKHIFK